jgi:hypothetical protein
LGCIFVKDPEQEPMKIMIDVIPSGGGEGIMNFLFPCHGLAGVVKNKFQPQEAEP